MLSKLTEHMRNKHDGSAPKPAGDATLEKPSTIEKQNVLNKQFVNFHREFSEGRNRAILERCIVELIETHIRLGSSKI